MQLLRKTAHGKCSAEKLTVIEQEANNTQCY